MQESLSSGMSIKLNIFDLDYPQKPPICIIPEGIHSVLSFFAFSDDSKSMSVSADWTNYSYDFTVSSAASGVKLVFMLGNVGTTENMAHTISIDDISLYKVS